MSLATAMLIATPVSAFLGTMLGHFLSRRSAKDLDRWRKREETMRLLRWATELAVDSDPDRARAGLVVLDALLDSPLLDHDDAQLVSTVTRYVAMGQVGAEESPEERGGALGS